MALILCLAQVASAQDIFEPGARWAHAPAAAEPWIPGSVTFAAGDQMVWGSGNFGTPRLMLLESDAADQSALRFEELVSGAAVVLEVAAARATEGLFALVQYPAPSLQMRRTEIAHYPLTAALAGAPFTPDWRHDTGVSSNAGAALASDPSGELVVVAVHSDTNSVQIDYLDGQSGSLLFRRSLAGSSVNELCIAADGSRVALSAGSDLWVLDAQANPVRHVLLPSPSAALALSDDARVLCYGRGNAVAIEERAVSGEYLLRPSLNGSPSEIPVRCDLSANGERLAIAWWNADSAVDVRFQVVESATHNQLIGVSQQGVRGGLQNFPEGMELSDDGGRVAFGTWGDSIHPAQLTLIDVDEVRTVLVRDLPGSLRALDMDASGTRVVVGYKHSHANQVGATGAIELIESGERDLQLAEPLRLAGSLRMRALEPQADEIYFMIGARRQEGLVLDRGAGTLYLDHAQRLIVLPGRMGPGGWAQLELEMGSDPVLIGTEFAVQALFRGPQGRTLSSTVLDLRIL